MPENDPISSDDLREVANELSRSRGGQEVARVPEAAPSAPASENGEDPNDVGMSLRVAAQRRAARTAREAQEREAYQRAAQLSERELPANLDATDSELAQQELAALRQTMSEVQQNQLNTGARMAAEQQQAQQIQQTNQGYEQARLWAANANAGLQALAEEEVKTLTETFGALSDAEIQRLYSTDVFFRETFDAARGRIAFAQQAQQQAIQQYAARFEELAQLHDSVFLEQNPDLQDAATKDAAGKGCIQLLKDAGYSTEDIEMGWRLGHGPLANIRSHAIQNGLLELWRSREAKRHLAAAKESGRAPPPRVQRPGTGSGGFGDETALRELNRALNEKGSVRAAAALLSAQRQYQRGSR